MLSTVDLEKLIAVKRHEINKEKIQLGLSEHSNKNNSQDHNNHAEQINHTEQVKYEEVDLSERNEAKTEDIKRNLYDLEEKIPPDLERYIRRYIGLPVMLKAGEYSPNNPLIRGEKTTGDALFGLGEYERRRDLLRKVRQQQYREYLDEQAKKKQEAKEQAEKERREREAKDREREEREKERLQLERERRSPDRRTSLNHVPNTNIAYPTKVDTGIQVSGTTKPLSVAVQTDDADFFRISPLLSKCEMTQAERELSPRTVDCEDILAKRWDTQRRRTYGDCQDALINKTNRDKLVSDLRHSYMPSIFDADAIQLRNLQAQKETAAKRQFYQQELKNQIMEQQRIKEERKSREKLLEQAEMRRLEEQLTMLNVAQEREIIKQYDITEQMKESSIDYENKRANLQKDIDLENHRLFHVKSQPTRTVTNNYRQATSKSDELPSKQTVMYPRIQEKRYNIKKHNFDVENALFLPDYDVDKYLRKNLNFSINNNDNEYNKDNDNGRYRENNSNNRNNRNGGYNRYNDGEYNRDNDNDKIKLPSERNNIISNERSIETDLLPIPILRHSPISDMKVTDNKKLSEAMRVVDDKWKVPAVQKNVLKKLPNEEGRKNISILTQLGSIRRQLQLEQLKLDNMAPKNIV